MHPGLGLGIDVFCGDLQLCSLMLASLHTPKLRADLRTTSRAHALEPFWYRKHVLRYKYRFGDKRNGLPLDAKHDNHKHLRWAQCSEFSHEIDRASRPVHSGFKGAAGLHVDYSHR